MKGIAIFVLLLLVGLGVATYVLTRPPDRTLSRSDRAWVDKYEAWAQGTWRVVDRASIGVGETAAKNDRLLRPLRPCTASLARLGQPSDLLKRVREAAQAACGEAQYAVRVNDRFEAASFATTKRHLYQAEDWLRLGRSRLREQLGPGG